jgi:putative sporulation protein YtaF
MVLSLGGVVHGATLALAVSTDVFVAFFGCGGRGIGLKRRTAVVSAVVCSCIFLAFGLIGSVATPFVPDEIEKYVGFATLMLIGLTRVFDRAVKAVIRRFRQRLSLIFKVYAEPELADLDAGGDLSIREGVLLASATSIDAAITALGSGMSGSYVLAAAAFTVVFSFAAVTLGVCLGRYLSGKCPLNLSVVGGVILIVLAITKLM